MKSTKPFPARRLCGGMAIALSVAAAGACVGKIKDTSSSRPPATSGTAAGSGGGSGAPNGTPTVAACTGSGAPPKARIWRLTKAQLANTLRDKFNFVPPAVSDFPDETRLSGFANRADDLKISPLLADGYFQAGDQLGAQAAAQPSSFGIGCSVSSMTTTPTCVKSFITTFGEKMWRRPVTDAEVAAMTTLFSTTAAQGDGPTGGVKAVAQAFFLSPNFLHRSELGSSQQPGTLAPLNDFEIASALSYTLWDSAPDDTLMTLAKQGKLHDAATLQSQAQRLLAATDRASAALHHFLQQWMYIEDLPDSDKDPTLFPLATASTQNDLIDETRLFMNSVLFDPAGDRSFKTLFTATYGFVNSRTAPIYGVQGVTGTTLTRHDLSAAQRRGLFTSASFMWAHANPGDTSLVDRGSYFRREVLCDPVAPPPQGIQQLNPQFASADATGRERFTLHSQPACAGCHKLFDGIGFAMENYDAIGSFRSTDKNKTIDASGTIPLPSGSQVTFSNFVELIDQLAQKPDVYRCFSTQYLSYASGRLMDDIDPCEKQAISDAFVKSNYKVDALVLNIVGSSNFVNRQN